MKNIDIENVKEMDLKVVIMMHVDMENLKEK